ncbi:hypothetical protein [Alistipes putredinis]|uniref:hypothetical protein n=1 Tax=Alistipes putredinis TaxID=28117 RepID=UPI003993D62D
MPAHGTSSRENTATQTLPIDIEQAYYLTSKSDFWLNVSGCNTLDEVRRQNPRLADTPPVREGRVYDNNRRRNAAGGSDFWESGVTASRPRAGGSGASSTPNSPKRTNCTITGSWNNAEAAPLRRIRPLLRFSRRRRPPRSFSANFLTVRK